MFKQGGKPHERLQGQGHVKMAYRCSKFNSAYCLLILRRKKNCLKKSTLDSFDDLGVAAAELYFF